MEFSHSLQSFDLPPELAAKSLALIGISGLDTKNNAIHKSIWDSFSSNRHIEQHSVSYMLIDNAHEFPVAKPKRNSYEWYIPKGIWKKNWMNKHLNEVPAVVVVFYELDWIDPQWNEKMIECVSRVQSMRAALHDRTTRITIVLIQNTAPLPAGEDILATERASALCASCELNAKSLFILPIGDHLQGYVARLEAAFHDLALNYYTNEIKTIKSHRDHLNKATHQYLFVRHQFKMGFLSEMKQDYHTAHKHYTNAYNNLVELRIVDTNANEIRTVAGFINYKLCKLMFSLNVPRDAIQQFRLHTDRFKTRIGFQDLAFEHYAWLSKQYLIFGDVFAEAVRSGLPAVQIQHPGIYYQQAAQFAIQRKNITADLCKSVTTYPNPDPLDGSALVEFYGQRPWRPAKLSSDPPDPQTESNGIIAIQYLEKQVNHSSHVVTLYGFAITQYKTYRCPRMRRQLVVEMADEYCYSKEYGKALTLLMHMLSDYRAECWSGILSNILEKALRCAYLTASVQDYLILALEALGSHILVSPEHKKLVYDNLNRILNLQIPIQEPSVLQQDITNAKNLWSHLRTQAKLNISLDIGDVDSCIELKACFLKDKYEIDENIVVEVYIRNCSSFPVLFSRATVVINTTESSKNVDVDIGAPNFKLASNDIKKFCVTFTPNPEDVDKEIQIGAVNLNLGNSIENIVDLKFTGLGKNSKLVPSEFEHFRQVPKNLNDFNKIKFITTAKLIPRRSNLSVTFKHENPALTEEWYCIEIQLANKEKYSISNLQFDFTLEDENSDTTEFSLKPNGPPDKIPIHFALAKMVPSETSSTKLYMKAYKVGNRAIGVKVTFVLDSALPISSITSDNLIVTVAKPFDVTTRLLTQLLVDAQKLYIDEQFVIMPVIHCQSVWPIYIEETILECDPSIENCDKTIKSQVSDMELLSAEVASEMYLATPKKVHGDQNVNLGTYTIKWRRSTSKAPTITKIPLIGLKVDWIPLQIKATLPAYGFQRTPILVQYHLTNKSHHLIQLEVSMEGNDMFMFAGYKQFQISILPESTKVLKYNLYPLVTGGVALPKMILSIPENSIESPALRDTHLKLLVARSLPTHLSIMPQSKVASPVDSTINIPMKTLVN